MQIGYTIYSTVRSDMANQHTPRREVDPEVLCETALELEYKVTFFP